MMINLDHQGGRLSYTPKMNASQNPLLSTNWASVNLSGPQIKAAREKLGLSQTDLAAALAVDFNIHLDRSDISEVERGVRGVRDYELKAIAAILGVTMDWLVNKK